MQRLEEKRDNNVYIESRIAAEVLPLSSVVQDAIDKEDMDLQRVSGAVQFIEPDLARVINRSQGGVSGTHVVSVAELSDGTILFVNAGFVPDGVDVTVVFPDTPVEVEGWLRNSVAREGLGLEDDLSDKNAPRFDIASLERRFPTENQVSPVWLQLDMYEGQKVDSVLQPVVLEALSEGSHKSYAVQWAVFALLVVIFYIAILQRKSRNI